MNIVTLKPVNNLAFRSIVQEISKNAKKGRYGIAEADSDGQEKKQDADAAPDASAQDQLGTPAQDSGEQEAQAPEQDAPAEKDTEAKDDSNVQKSDVAQAEDDLDKPAFVKLNSDGGIKFLLNSILQPAIETNTVDSIAQDFVEKLKISTDEELKKFKSETTQFRGILGYNDLLQSMENFINGS